MKGLKDWMNYKYCGDAVTTNEVTRAVKGGRFKLYCVSFASSNLAPHIELFLMSDIISKMVLIEPDSRKFRIMALFSVWAIKHLKDPSSILGISLIFRGFKKDSK